MIIGLDFGTSYSQAAAMQLDEPVLLMPSGIYGIPSAFYYDRDAGVLVGTDALDEGQGTNSINLRTNVKLDLSESFTADGRCFTSEEMVSEIYRYVYDVAKRVALQKRVNNAENIDGAVISAPVNFTAQEIDLIKKACAKPSSEGGAGLNVHAVIKEPVAAAIAYFRAGSLKAENILVFDLGGGTCDIALLHNDSAENVHYTVLDSDMIRTGASMWDEKLCAYIAYDLAQQIGEDLNGNQSFMRKIRTAAIEVKHSLTEHKFKNARIEINGTVYKTRDEDSIYDALEERRQRQEKAKQKAEIFGKDKKGPVK